MLTSTLLNTKVRLFAGILTMTLSSFAKSDACSFASVEEAVANSMVVVEAEKLYSGLTFDKFEEQYRQRHGDGDRGEPNALLSAWKAYSDGRPYVDFLVWDSLKGNHLPGDVLQVEQNTVLQRLYGVGNKFILFLEKAEGEGYYLDTCTRVDISRRYATIFFKEYTHDKFDALVSGVKQQLESKGEESLKTSNKKRNLRRP